MSFFLGLILGIAAGVGIVMVFVRSENSRAKGRAELAETIAAFSKMTVEDSRKILPPEFYPSWVVFSNRQKLNWLNLELTKIWPFVNEAASELIRTSVEPVLEQYRSTILSSLKFSKLTLGTVAPQFTGGSWMFNGLLIVLKHWDPLVSFMRDLLVAVPTWVQFAKLPLQIWNDPSLREIASVIGNTFRMDDTTARRKRQTFAKG